MADADIGVFGRYKTFQDFQRANQEAALQQKLVQAKIQKANQEAMAGTDDPAAVREYQFYNNLDDDGKREFLRVKRADKILNMGQGYNVYDPTTNQTAPIPGAAIQPGPKQQADIDAKVREEQDKFNRALDVKQKALAATERLLANPAGVRANRGGISTLFPNIQDSSVDANADLETLTNLMTTENLGLLKGVLSDTDMKVLASIGSGELAGSDEKVLAALKRMRQALAGKVAQATQFKGQTIPPLMSSIDGTAPLFDSSVPGLDQGQPIPTPPSSLSKIPMSAAKYLKENPQLRNEFDAKYGAGASRIVLGK